MKTVSCCPRVRTLEPDSTLPGRRAAVRARKFSFFASRLCALGLMLVPLRSPSATNDLAAALQRGLFEEEGNRNLEAAAEAYQTASALYARDRKLAATAIFRLGEVYRKLGRTNEALAQYERILREFPDEQTLASLSRERFAELQPQRSGFSERLAAVISRVAEGPGLFDDEEKEIHRLRALIQNSPDLINGPSGEDGLTPLCRAASKGQLRVARFLLEAGAAVNHPSRDSTPLHFAAANGHKAMVELLLARGAEVNAADKTGQTALHKAAEKGFLSVTESLLAAKADPNACDNQNRTPLTLAVLGGFHPVAAALLARGANPNIVSEGPAGGWPSWLNQGAPLHLAVAKGDETMVALLLTNKTDASLRNQIDQPPLLIAAALGQTAIAARLIAAGADVNAKSSSKAPHKRLGQFTIPPMTAKITTPLMEAVISNHIETASLLLRNKADPNLSDANGQTPLHLAIRCGHTEMLRTLLAHGADPNSKTKGTDVTVGDAAGDTPLHWAVRFKRPEHLKLLLDAKADPNVLNNSGTTPLDLAKSMGNEGKPLADLLRQYGALDVLPDFSTIRVARAMQGPFVVFEKDSAGRNRFTLFEVLLQCFTPGPPRPSSPFLYPDLSRIRIQRFSPARPADRTDIIVNLLNATNGIECSKNLPLEFGDLIEIPEREHALAEPRVELTAEQRAQLAQCVPKRVRLVARGGSADIGLPPDRAFLRAALETDAAKKLLRTSSDLSRVKVSRKDPATARTEQFMVDCPEWAAPATPPVVLPPLPAAVFLKAGPVALSPISKDDLWLQDGDVIEVPDKP